MRKEDNKEPAAAGTSASEKAQIGMLLQRIRPDKDQQLVEEIARSDMKADEKIRKIMGVDQKLSEMEGALDMKPNPVEVKVEKKPFSMEEVAKKNRRLIKVRQKKEKYFQFLFKHFLKIREFGKKSGLISSSFFPPRVWINPEYKKVVLPGFQNDSAILIRALKPLLQTGWIFLEKTEYNLLVQFRKLCESILNAAPENKQKTGVLELFREVERRFLVCQYQPEFAPIIIDSIIMLMKRSKRNDHDIQEALFHLRRLLTANTANPSLFDFLLVLNMAEYKKFLEFKEILQLVPGILISNFRYECDPQTQVEIDQYIEKNEAKIDELVARKMEIDKVERFMKRFVGEGSSGGDDIDFRLLRQLYDYGSRTGKTGFSQDQNALPVFAQNLFLQFTDNLDPLMGDKVEVEGFGPIRIFEKDMFKREFGVMQTMIHHLSQESFNSPHLSRERLYQIKYPHKDTNPSQGEASIFKALTSISDIVLEIGKKVGAVCMIYQEQPDGAANKGGIEPVSQAVIDRGYYSVPYWNKKIQIKGYFDGQTVEGALGQIASISFLIACFFYDDNMQSALSDRRSYIEEIQAIKKVLKRVADPAVYETIHRKYPF
ncbi:MAG: hypothetical protein A2Y33_16655 [Spirochaetes bacterium GWF1_51_8]|nr:MAG: hypothetical protein A2Y33_16655 [Spirochaetes bacterium GWF1_51_8]